MRYSGVVAWCLSCLTFTVACAAPASSTSPAPQKLAYGTLPQQFGVLYLPATPGPYPVVALLHGGCWQHHIATWQNVEPLAAELTRHGWAVWNVEYRGVDEQGGGWPGTFQDAAAGLDYVRTLASKFPLDIKRVTFMGHSAGGHLALWGANRSAIPDTSVLFAGHPLVPQRVITLGGITDLPDYLASGSNCGQAVEPLMGGGTPAETSPRAMLPTQVATTLITAQADQIVPASQAALYAQESAHMAHVVSVPGDHFGLVYPGGAPLAAILRALAQ